MSSDKKDLNVTPTKTAKVTKVGTAGEGSGAQLYPAFTSVNQVFMDLAWTEAELGELLEGLQAYEYQGFDPLVVMNEIRSKASKNQRDLKKDLMALVSCGIVRGTKLEKAMKKCSPKVQVNLSTLMIIYGIKDSAPTSRTDITMARILALCPHLVARVIKGAKGHYFAATPLPDPLRTLCFPGAGALIPKGPEWAPILAHWRTWCAMFSKVIGAKSTAGVDYQTIVHNSPLIPDQVRVRTMESLGITSKIEGLDFTVFNEAKAALGVI